MISYFWVLDVFEISLYCATGWSLEVRHLLHIISGVQLHSSNISLSVFYRTKFIARAFLVTTKSTSIIERPRRLTNLPNHSVEFAEKLRPPLRSVVEQFVREESHRLLDAIAPTNKGLSTRMAPARSL